MQLCHLVCFFASLSYCLMLINRSAWTRPAFLRDLSSDAFLSSCTTSQHFSNFFFHIYHAIQGEIQNQHIADKNSYNFLTHKYNGSSIYQEKKKGGGGYRKKSPQNIISIHSANMKFLLLKTTYSHIRVVVTSEQICLSGLWYHQAPFIMLWTCPSVLPITFPLQYSPNCSEEPVFNPLNHFIADRHQEADLLQEN